MPQHGPSKAPPPTTSCHTALQNISPSFSFESEGRLTMKADILASVPQYWSRGLVEKVRG